MKKLDLDQEIDENLKKIKQYRKLCLNPQLGISPLLKDSLSEIYQLKQELKE